MVWKGLQKAIYFDVSIVIVLKFKLNILQVKFLNKYKWKFVTSHWDKYDFKCLLQSDTRFWIICILKNKPLHNQSPLGQSAHWWLIGRHFDRGNSEAQLDFYVQSKWTRYAWTKYTLMTTWTLPWSWQQGNALWLLVQLSPLAKVYFVQAHFNRVNAA